MKEWWRRIVLLLISSWLRQLIFSFSSRLMKSFRRLFRLLFPLRGEFIYGAEGRKSCWINIAVVISIVFFSYRLIGTVIAWYLWVSLELHCTLLTKWFSGRFLDDTQNSRVEFRLRVAFNLLSIGVLKKMIRRSMTSDEVCPIMNFFFFLILQPFIPTLN